MARPTKQGLDYFPHDTHPDNKLERFFLLYEAKGKSFIYTLWEEIYSEGWQLSIADSDTVRILAKKAFCTFEEWNAMLAAALRLGLFDVTFWEREMVLTSNGIRRRYAIVAQRRAANAQYYDRKKAERQVPKQEEKEFHTPETGTETPLSVGFHLRAKGKERKEEEEKEKRGPQRKHAFEKSSIFPLENFEAAFPDWAPEKRVHYFERAKGYSLANGGRYLSWKQAILNWDRDRPWRQDGQNGSGRGHRPETRSQRMDRQASEFKRELEEGNPQANLPDLPELRAAGGG